MAGCGAVTFKRNHLNAQKPQLRSARTLDVVLSRIEKFAKFTKDYFNYFVHHLSFHINAHG